MNAIFKKNNNVFIILKNWEYNAMEIIGLVIPTPNMKPIIYSSCSALE